MPYAKPDDLRRVWNKVLTTNLVPEEIAEAIDNAGALVDAALARRYVVPFATDPDATPPIIRRITARLAFLDVIDRSPATPDFLLRMIERAEKELEMLASGDLSIVGLTGGVLPERTDTGGVQSSTADFVPTFGARSSLRERVDPVRGDAEEDARIATDNSLRWP